MGDGSLIHSSLLAGHGFLGLFTTRLNGVSPLPFDSLNFGYGLGDDDGNVRRNFELLAEKSGLSGAPHMVRQVHKADAVWCRGAGIQHTQEADILLSDQADVALAVRTADCLPLLLADPATGITAAVHAGWRGTVAGAAAEAVARMAAHGSRPEVILASLGPCIGPCCFVIDETTADRLAACTPGAEEEIRYVPQRSADIAAINRRQLLHAGLQAGHIEMSNRCTSCEAQLFFSHRRDHGRTGRHLAVVAHPASA